MMTVVGAKDATSTTTTKFGLETLVNDEVAMMTWAVGAELSTTLRQCTETSMTMTVVGGETSVTSRDAVINDSESQTKKSTTTTAVGFEVTTTSRQQTKTLWTTTEVVVATPVISNVPTTMTDDSF